MFRCVHYLHWLNSVHVLLKQENMDIVHKIGLTGLHEGL
jgi:hypothetical protein